MTRKRVARSLKERQIEKNNTRSVSSLFQIFIRNMRKNLSCPKQNKENERQIFFNKNFPSTLQETRQSSYFFFSLSLTFFNILRINSQETLCGIGGGQSREKINFGKQRGTISGRNLHGLWVIEDLARVVKIFFIPRSCVSYDLYAAVQHRRHLLLGMLALTGRRR